MEKSEVQLWLRNPVTIWFFELLNARMQHVDEWFVVTDDKLLAMYQGKKQVLDAIKYILDNPESE